ncbi:MAG: 50S ribosomal protein L21 [Caldiserica bacterium]|jgi:large subunit ribosomal protein L21|nr:50S ribosomal protein L21 [Caldisericota bacterium]MDH7563158.1 50S ribosomal protein L21 [Caldisericota bacterium]
MYAVIHLGGKQYKVQPGMTFKVDYLEGEVGKPLELEKVSLVVDKEKVLVGKPWVEGAKVKVTVLEHGRDKKVQVFTYKSKTNFKRMQGHRQDITTLRVDQILYPGQEE